jgi:hypothetical protein
MREPFVWPPRLFWTRGEWRRQYVLGDFLIDQQPLLGDSHELCGNNRKSAALDPIGFHFRFRVLLSFVFWGTAGFTKIKSLRSGILA